MSIKLHEISIRDLVDGYRNDDEEGVVAYHGLLNVRPKYQREFVYKDSKRDAVIRSILSDFPLGVMYWVKNEDGTMEMLDGQQRTISICEYVASKSFSIESFYFHNLEYSKPEQAQAILDYKLQVYFCEGTVDEKLEWFKTINIGTEPLTDQEMRNAFYTGEWLTSAKRYFSKSTGKGVKKNESLISGDPKRQLLLEKVLLWKAELEGITKKTTNDVVKEYMGLHQYDKDADAEWQYFSKVIDWATLLFDKKIKLCKGQPWGELYNLYHRNVYNSEELKAQCKKLSIDDEITNKNGIIRFLLSGEEKYLSLRTFSEQQRIKMYEMQNGICPICKKHFDITEMEADHIDPWSQGGKTTIENGQMLCQSCNRRKSDK